MRLCVGLFVMAAVGVASADDIDKLGGAVIELDSRIGDLDRNLKAPPPPGPEYAERRLIDAQVLYELKNYEYASIILFDVVEKYPNAPAYPEALFYLADSLFLKRDFLSSRRYFEKIVEQGPVNRRYQESLQRLIELSLHTGDYSPVEGYIEKLAKMPPTKQLPSVPYVEGKYFFFRGQHDKALAALGQIGPDHPYYFHALYFIGSSHVAGGPEHLNDALQAFGTILKATAKTDAQKQIVELSHMAMARIYYDRGQFTNALSEYAKISNKSSLFNDALYESAWVGIKSKEYDKAARALDLLLLNAPDSPLVPEVKLLLGQLHIREQAYGPATESFTKARDQFAPIHRQLADQLVKMGDPPGYFRDLINKNLSKFDTNTVLPAGSAKWIKNEPQVQEVAALVGDEAELKKSLDESDEIIKRLDKAMNGPQRVNVFPELASARAKAAAVSNETSVVKQALAARMSKLLRPVAGAEAELRQLENERDQLERKLAKLPTSADSIRARQDDAKGKMNELDKRVVELQTQLNGVRAQAVATRKYYEDQIRNSTPADRQADAQRELDGMVSEVDGEGDSSDRLRKDIDDAKLSVGVDDADMQATQQLRAQYDDVLRRLHDLDVRVRAQLSSQDRARAEQIDSILDRARNVETKVTRFNGRIDGLLDEQLKDKLAEVNDERMKVAAYRQKLTGYTGESADVGGGVLADNFKAVTQRFYNVVVRADVGIIDVAWALKDSATRGSTQLLAERKRELKLLDDEYKDLAKEQAGTPGQKEQQP